MWHYAKEQERHGPVSQEQLLGLLRSGALADHDLVWREGMAAWQAAGEVMELQRALFGSRVPEAAGSTMSVAPPQNGLAITSLVLGIVSIVAMTLIITAIPGVVCGHIARRQIREAPGVQSGEGMAIAGLILGYIAIILSLAFIALMVAMFYSIS
ncbi:MAG: DUF4190 domain-containing protein [Verrucomicrobia bacterium]|nr:DUF4190 domain-containing protein [Verrucomicrobiota bacterium]